MGLGTGNPIIGDSYKSLMNNIKFARTMLKNLKIVIYMLFLNSSIIC